MMLVCSNYKPVLDTNAPALAPGVVPSPPKESQKARFELKAVRPCNRCMMRIAMANNCTTGQNPQYCDNYQSNDQTAYTSLLRAHADTYPTGTTHIISLLSPPFSHTIFTITTPRSSGSSIYEDRPYLEFLL